MLHWYSSFEINIREKKIGENEGTAYRQWKILYHLSQDFGSLCPPTLSVGAGPATLKDLPVFVTVENIFGSAPLTP